MDNSVVVYRIHNYVIENEQATCTSENDHFERKRLTSNLWENPAITARDSLSISSIGSNRTYAEVQWIESFEREDSPLSYRINDPIGVGNMPGSYQVQTYLN